MQIDNVHRACLQLLDGRELVHAFTHPFPDCENHVDDRFLASGALERSRVHRVIASVAVQLFDDRACLLVAAPEVARPDPGLSEPGQQRRESSR
jgi:hypothetical protein